jgi:hypothetical protein
MEKRRCVYWAALATIFTFFVSFILWATYVLLRHSLNGKYTPQIDQGASAFIVCLLFFIYLIIKLKSNEFRKSVLLGYHQRIISGIICIPLIVGSPILSFAIMKLVNILSNSSVIVRDDLYVSFSISFALMTLLVLLFFKKFAIHPEKNDR